VRSGKVKWEPAYPIIETQISADGRHDWPFDPLFPIDVRFLICGKQARMPRRHDYFELLYVASCEFVCQVHDRCFAVREGDLFVMGSTLMHRIVDCPGGSVKIVVLYFLPELIQPPGTTGDDVHYLMPFLVQDADFAHVVPAAAGLPAQIHDLMLRIGEELPATSNRGRLAVKTYLKMILMLLVNHYAVSWDGEEVFLRKQRELERLRPVFDLVDRQYRGKVTVAQAAAVMNLSRSSFMRYFKKVTGTPFVVYLNRFRVARAEALLATTEKPIAEIGQEVGFCDQSYFGAVFRSIVHLTPREYKQRVDQTRTSGG
jgi:AraC-like DNA-binding protein